MIDLHRRLEEEAAARGETLADAVRHHLLAGLVARVAKTPEGEGFVLRGGMATRAWVSPLSRPTRDLDYVGDFDFSVEEAARRFQAGLRVKVDDEIVVDEVSFRWKGIWLDTAFPGARFTVAVGLGDFAEGPVTVDVGFRDPLVPEPGSLVVAGVRVRCVRPETQVAWKLHALAEMGAGFRPKDLADLWRITAHVPLADLALAEAIVPAFTSRGYSLDDARAVLEHPHWSTKSTRVRWSPNRSGAGLPPLPRVLQDVRERLARALATLPEPASHADRP